MVVVPKFTIHPPCTMDDIKGESTDSLENDVRHIFNLIDDERHLVAHSLYVSVILRIQQFESLYNIIVPPSITLLAANDNDNNNTTTNAQSNGMSTSVGVSNTNGKSTISTTVPTEGTENNNNNTSSSTTKRNIFSTSRGVATTATNNTYTSSSSSDYDTKIVLLTKKMNKVEKLKFDTTLQEISKVKQYLNAKQNQIIKLENYSRIFKKAQKNMTEDTNWIVASKNGGITTSYRREEDSSFTVKIHGGLDNLPIFEQICVLKEVDLYSTWAPFCSSSISIANIDKLDNVGWLLVGLPRFGLARDACYRSIGCDNTTIDGSIIVSAQGVFDHMPGTPINVTTSQNQLDTYLSDDPLLLQLDIPAPPTGYFSGRMTINKFDALIRITSPTAAETTIVVNVNPNLSYVPDYLIEYVMKRMLGELLASLQAAAKKIIRNPIHNKHAQLMRNEEYPFYHDWLLPKVETICRMNGWDVPTIAAFNLTKQQILEEQLYLDKHGGHSIKRKDVPSDDEDDMRTEISLSGEGRSPSNDDLVSDISSRDGGRSDVRSLLLKRNVIIKYLQEQENKVQQRKEAEIAVRRERVRQINTPKERTQVQNQRLAELKFARSRRLGSLPVERTISLDIFGPSDGDVDNTDNGNEQKKFPQEQNGSKDDTGASLTKNDMTIQQPKAGKHPAKSQNLLRHLYNIQVVYTRVIVLLLFFIILCVTLHADYWIQAVEVIPLPLFSSSSFTIQQLYNDTRWYTMLLQDIAVVLYMFIFCSIPNYLLCDIALVYTFDSLQIGSKAGKRVKQHFIENSSVIVAVLSFGIVSFSIAKSLWFISIRYIIVSMISLMKDALNRIGNNIPDAFLAFTKEGTSSIVLKYMYSMISSIASFLYWLLFRSNIVSRGFEAILMTALSITYKSILLLVGGSFDKTDDRQMYSSWRYDAFTTARTLFLHIVMFVLCTLVIFIMYAKSSTKERDRGVVDKSTNKGKLEREVSELSTDGVVPTDDSTGQGQEEMDTNNRSMLPTGRSQSTGDIGKINSIIARTKLHSSMNGVKELNDTNHSLSTSSNSKRKKNSKQQQQQQWHQRRPSLAFLRGNKQKQAVTSSLVEK